MRHSRLAAGGGEEVVAEQHPQGWLNLRVALKLEVIDEEVSAVKGVADVLAGLIAALPLVAGHEVVDL